MGDKRTDLEILRDLNIPSEITIFHHIIHVIIDDNLVQKENNVGEARFRDNEIRLQNPDVFYVPNSRMTGTFWHEVAHFVAHFMGDYELRDDETKIELMGNILAQIDYSRQK